MLVWNYIQRIKKRTGHMVPKYAALIGLCAITGYAHAATLRPSGTVNGDSVYLSDIFSGLGSGQDRILGPAPAPGKTIYIAGAQLIALADQYGVDWDDQSSSAQISLTRAGHTLGRDEFALLVKKAVMQDEGSGSILVHITDFTPITVSEGEADPVTISNLNWDRKTSKFTATAQPAHPAGADSFPLRGTIRIAAPVMVYSHNLPSGHIIQDDDMNINAGFTGEIPPLAASLPEPEKMVGMALTRSVSAGQPVQSTDLKRETLIHHGDPILISYSVPGLRLTATGRALEDGGAGQFVHVINLGNHMILVGRVSGTSEVRVDASSTAIPPDSEEAKRLGINNMTLGSMK